MAHLESYLADGCCPRGGTYFSGTQLLPISILLYIWKWSLRFGKWQHESPGDDAFAGVGLELEMGSIPASQ